MSLRIKFTLFSTLLIIVIISGISASIFVTQKKLLSAQLEENRQKILTDFTYACREALTVSDEIQVLGTLRSITKTHNPAIVYTGYVSLSDVVLYSGRDMGMDRYFKPRIFRVSQTSIRDFVSVQVEKIREYAIPLYRDINGVSKYLGTIKVGFSQTYMESQIQKGVVLLGKKILGVSVLALILGFVLANVLSFYLNKPIRELAEAVEDIGSGNLDSHVTINRSDELGKLGKAFNEMTRKLKEIDELKDSFVSSVSHELRSPLAAIDGYCDYLLESLAKNLPREKQEKSLRIIKDATIRLTNFINNILDLAKIRAGRLEIKKSPVTVSEIVLEIVSLFESLANQQKKQLVAQLADSLPSIDADPERIKQVITNLIGNALKFTPENAVITVGANPPDPNESPATVEIWIADTGVGIPAEAMQRIFDKFYQVAESGMKKPKGTGLGLAIAADIVHLHGGKIWVESTVGKGSTFRFTVPVWKVTP